MAKITMADGTVFEGTAEEFAEMAKFMGEGAEALTEPKAEEVDGLKTEPKTEPKTEYEIGDKARVIGDEFSHHFDIGTVVERVEGVGGLSRYPLFKQVGGNKTQYLKPSDLEPIAEDAAGEPEVEPKGYVKIPNELAKAGDLIRFIETKFMDDVTIGKSYEITDVYKNGVDPHFIDDVGEGNYAETESEEYEIYRKPIEGAPQVGDKILVTDASFSLTRYKNGDVGTVSQVYSDGDIAVEEHHVLLHEEEFVVIDRPEKAESPADKTSANVKVGDTIKVTHCNAGERKKGFSGWGVHGQGLIAIGSVGEVTSIEGKGVSVQFVTNTGGSDSPVRKLVLEYGEFEIVGKTPEESTFKVGDKVRLLSGGGESRLFGLFNGGECEVKGESDPNDGGRIRIASNNGIRGFALPEQLEKIGDSSPKASDFTEGDILRFKKSDGTTGVAEVRDIGYYSIGVVTLDDREDGRDYFAVNFDEGDTAQLIVKNANREDV